MEKITNYIYKSNTGFDKMHGFLPKKSVTSCLLEINDEFTRALDEKKSIDLVIFDISKAFDSINHELLIRKLVNLGISGNCLEWIQSYLNNRSAAVKINNHLSSFKYTDQGVPQGSPLSPFLFNCFLLDFFQQELKNVIVKAYADDIKAFIIFDKHNQHSKKLELDNFINNFYLWLKQNGLNLSSNKSKIIHMGLNNPRFNYSINSVPLFCSDEPFKILGVTFLHNLSFRIHIQDKCLVAIRLWFNLMRTIRSTDHNVLIRIFKSYVRPHLEFASQIFNDYSKGTTDIIEKVQRKITKYIFFRSKYLGKNSLNQCPNYSKRLTILNLEPLYIRRFKADLITFFKISKGFLKINKSNLPDSQTFITLEIIAH